MLRNTILSITSLLFLGAIFLSCSESADASDNSHAVLEIKKVEESSTNQAPNFTFTVDGNETNFREYTKGKLVFLNFWGTWCPPCRAEIPDIIEMQKELEDKGFLVIGIAIEKSQNPQDAMPGVRKFMDSQGINYHNFVTNIRGPIVKAYGGIQGVPSTFIIDREGNRVEKIVGFRKKEQFMEIVNKYL